MAIRTNDITFCDFGLQRLKRHKSVVRIVGEVEELLLTLPMVEVHYIMRIALIAICARLILRCPVNRFEFGPVSQSVGDVFLPVFPVMLPFVVLVTGLAITLTSAVRPEIKLADWLQDSTATAPPQLCFFHEVHRLARGS
jgi:hypothetical protein